MMTAVFKHMKCKKKRLIKASNSPVMRTAVGLWLITVRVVFFLCCVLNITSFNNAEVIMNWSSCDSA